MLSEKHLTDILQLIENCKHMSDLPVREINGLKIDVEIERYASQVKSFYSHVIHSLPEFDRNNEPKFEREMDAFYNCGWTITFNGKSVTLENGADIYDTFLVLLENHMEDAGIPYSKSIRRVANDLYYTKDLVYRIKHARAEEDIDALTELEYTLEDFLEDNIDNMLKELQRHV